MLHRLAFQRQGRFPCSVPLVLRALLHIFPTQNQHVSSGGPIITLKRNVKRPCGLQIYIFQRKIMFYEKSTFLIKTTFVAHSKKQSIKQSNKQSINQTNRQSIKDQTTQKKTKKVKINQGCLITIVIRISIGIILFAPVLTLVSV